MTKTSAHVEKHIDLNESAENQGSQMVYFHTKILIWVYFHTKIPNWVYFGGPWNGKWGVTLCRFGIFYGDLEYFIAIWNILWLFCDIWYVLVGLGMENGGYTFGHLEYLRAIWHILWPFCDHLVYFPRFVMFYQEESGNPAENIQLLELKHIYVA
jgi:hypothetical protein